MLKLLLSLLLLSLALIAGDKVEIYASSIDSKGDIVTSSGGVTLVYKEYILHADRSVYNRKTGDMELFGNIRLNQGKSYKALGKYAKLNLAKKERLFQPFFMSDNESQLWMSAAEGSTTDKDIFIKSGVLSGCNPIDPIWKMEFSSLDYDAKTKWTNAYNARLYIGDILLFYTPYIGYSLDHTRRTGLLIPSVGYSVNEGVYFEQPLYIAEQNWWDLQIKPQLRSSRGYGVYQTFRFVDSKISHGEIRAGYFKENEKYFRENKLQNSSHYGFEVDYDNSDFINQWFGTALEGQSGLYAEIKHMNDVDYINLATNNIQNSTTATQILSRINMFYNKEKHYLGAYLKYYQDLAVASNAQTLQKLPTLQYHYYLNTFLKDHFLYNFDIKANNITRTLGKKALQTDMNLPLTLQTSLFDEYITVAYDANIYMQTSQFLGEEYPSSGNEYKNGYLFRNTHTLSAASQLIRKYDEYSHVVGLRVSYNRAGVESKSGFYEDNAEFCADPENVRNPRCEFYNITPVQDEMQLDFTQYLYDNKAREVIYHRLAQKIFYSHAVEKYGELENELDYKITSFLSYYNNMLYNYTQKRFSKIFNEVGYHDYGVNVRLSHLYKDSFIEATDTLARYTSYLTSTIGYTYDTHYSFNALYNYDIEAKEKKSMEVGFLYKQRCWDFGLKYSENRRPILTTEGDSFVDDRYIYLSLVLRPIMQASDGSSLLTWQLPQKK